MDVESYPSYFYLWCSGWLAKWYVFSTIYKTELYRAGACRVMYWVILYECFSVIRRGATVTTVVNGDLNKQTLQRHPRVQFDKLWLNPSLVISHIDMTCWREGRRPWYSRQHWLMAIPISTVTSLTLFSSFQHNINKINTPEISFLLLWQMINTVYLGIYYSWWLPK